MRLSTKVLLLLTFIFIVGLTIVFWGNDTVLAAKRLFAATPDAQGRLTIVATDYDFTPDVVRVKAGQQIKLTIRNEGLHTHEFMVGKQVHLENGSTEPPTPDFFEGLQVEVTGSGMPMGFAGMEGMDMSGMDMGNSDSGMDMDSSDSGMDMSEDDHADGDMDMQQDGEAEHMEAAGDEHDDQMSGDMTGDENAEDMAMEDEHANDEMDMSGDDGMDMDMGEGAKVVLPGAHAEPMEMGHDEHHGGMVMVNPAQESTIIMTIPEDKVGVWTFGCFQEEGLHFDSGMHGTFIVER